MSQCKGRQLRSQRIARHQDYEVEKRAISTSTVGGVVVPQYLVDLYAKASRNGRVYADQVNGSNPLPDEGMSVIVPRFTANLWAGIQASESRTRRASPWFPERQVSF